MLTEQQIDELLFLKFSGATKAEQKLIHSDTLDFCAWCERQGKTWPDSEAYEGYRIERKLRVGKTPKQKYLAGDKAVARVQAVFEALADQKGEQQMSEQVIQTEQVASAADTQSVGEASTKRRGRKVKPDAERRSVKISIYLTHDVYDGMRDLAAASKQDVSDIFFTLASEFVERNADKLNTVRSFFASLGVIK